MKKLHSKQETCNSTGNKTPILVSLPEAGNMLSISSRTIRRMSLDGELPPIVKVGGSSRISYQGVYDYAQNLTLGNPNTGGA